jgi:hypothetical protein
MCFHDAYQLWLEDCLQEYNKRFNENRTLITGEDYDPGTVIEFADDGSAYPHGQGGTNWIPNAVTPWADSVHYFP